MRKKRKIKEKIERAKGNDNARKRILMWNQQTDNTILGK